MKKIVMLVVALVLASSLASGQSILERLRQKGREVIENAVTGGANQQEEQPEQPQQRLSFSLIQGKPYATWTLLATTVLVKVRPEEESHSCQFSLSVE